MRYDEALGNGGQSMGLSNRLLAGGRALTIEHVQPPATIARHRSEPLSSPCLTMAKSAFQPLTGPWGFDPMEQFQSVVHPSLGTCGGNPIFLLVEDLEDDVLLIRRSILRANIVNALQVVRNGEEAIEYLSGAGRFENRIEFPLPAVVLLDLKMPRADGFEVLRWIKSQPSLQSLRVVVLTSSDEIRDVNLAYQLGAASFLVKPVDFEKFVEVAMAISGYWIWTNKAPETSRPSDQPIVRRPSAYLW